MEDKKQIRKFIAAKKKFMPKSELQNRSDVIMKEIELSQEFIAAKTILAYWSMPDEVQTHQFIEKWNDVKNFLLPQVDGDNLKVRVYEGPKSFKKNPSFNVYEPTGKEEKNLNKIDLVIVPGIAFDRKNNRLGRGKGYYDRFLTKVKKAVKMGVAFDFQLVREIPVDKTDVPVDLVITD